MFFNSIVFFNRLFTKSVYYNILSAINVLMGFLFIVLMIRTLGVGEATDVYFLSVIMLTYSGYIVQATWDAFRPYYMELKYSLTLDEGMLYSVIINLIIAVSSLIILIYFIFVYFVYTPAKYIDFYNIFVFYLLVQNVLIFNKAVLNLEGYYSIYYLVDIFVYTVNCLGLLFFSNSIMDVALFSIAGTLVMVVVQLYILIFKVKLSYNMKLFNTHFKIIHFNSIKSKAGVLLYGLKDPLIASLCLGYGAGFLSIYNYANKFASAVFQVVNAPIVNIYITKVNELIAKKKFDVIKSEIKKVLYKTIFMYLLASVAVYLFLSTKGLVLLNNELVNEDVAKLKVIFLLLILFYFVITLETPYSRLISAFKDFNYALLVNFLFFCLVIVLFFSVKYDQLQFYTFLFLLSFIQASNYLLYKRKCEQHLSNKE